MANPANDDQGLDNQLYYNEIIRYLQDPTQVSSADWVKTQAANYFMKDGELFYGRRRPRKVILDEQAKSVILKQIHVDETKGFHNGVKKMHRLLQKECFWRYSYKSITEFVQNCPVCKSNSMPTTLNLIKPSKVLSPWKEIEFHLIKPNESHEDDHKFVVIYDPVSLWVSVAAIKPCSSDMAEFILENYSNYGVATCTIYGLNSAQFLELKEEFIKLVEATETASSLTLGVEELLKFSEERSSNFDDNLKTRVELYFQKHPNDWNKRSVLLGWLWKLRNEFASNTFDYCLTAKSSNRNPPLKQRKITKPFRCPSCVQTFDSAILLKLHASTHSSVERMTRSSNSKHLVSQNGSNNHQASDTSTTSQPLDDRVSTSATVAAVRALIAQTKETRKSKEERHKRGEYHRYTPEIREAIAVHAIRHGTHNAARTFSASLGFAVSYSSVRNFVQAYHAFNSQTKVEIGRYAAECGIDAAQKLYSTKLNKSISEALVRKFRRMYLRITPANQLNLPSGSQRKSNSVVRYLFCTSVREEIGKYAASHGVQAAVRHFSEKLQFPVKESTVRKFKKIFGSSSTSHRPQQTTPIIRPPSLPHPSSMTVLPPPPPPPPLSIVHQQTMEPSYYHQPYGHYTATQYGNHQQINNYHSHHQSLYVMAQPVPPYPSYSALPPPPQYQPSMQLPAYSRNWNEECQEELLAPQDNHPPTCLTLPRPPSPVAAPPPLELNPAIRMPVRLEKTVEKKKSSKKSGRGSYATYSPQFRLEIGRFAVKHGCQEAAQFFKERVGHEIPESTVRGLRDKYIAQQSTCEEEVSSLSVIPRGRPLRLGSHDGAVQECIRELKCSGERVNAFVVMATARQVLLQKEPSLLAEFGGPVKLTTNWAKSFLKRIGINKESNLQNTSDPTAQDE